MLLQALLQRESLHRKAIVSTIRVDTVMRVGNM